MSRLIDADALLGKAWDAENGFGWEKVVSIKDVMTAPTIDPVKRERWVKRTDENCWWYECSECGGYPMKNVYGHEELSAYCPHCGARMEGEEDER